MALASEDYTVVDEANQEALLGLPCWSTYQPEDEAVPGAQIQQLQRVSCCSGRFVVFILTYVDRRCCASGLG
jgi:hypothetical protein